MVKKISLKVYKRIFTGVLALGFVVAGVATGAFSFAWFSNNNNITQNINGYTTGAYFARGKGTKDDPYVINRPIHFYNLAWLQYIGYFKGKEPYFVIENDLNMKDMVLPPIGTKENPFLGHLDGTSKKISNLTISNSFDEYKGKHPSSQTSSNFVSPEITGVFGVVGDTASNTVPTIRDVYLEKTTVHSSTDKALTGVVAGYVNGGLNNIRINDSSLNLKDGTNNLDGYSNISKYTSVGYCEPKYQTTYVKNNTTMYEPQYIGNSSFNPTGGGGGQDDDWGGSIDILSLSKRVSLMTKTLVKKKVNPSDKDEKDPNPYKTFASDVYHLYAGTSKYDGEAYNWQDTNGVSAMIMGDGTNENYKGTYLPLNITNEIDDNFYKKDSPMPEVVSNTNTGYLTGGGGSSGNATVRLRNQKTNKDGQGIKKSFGSFKNDSESQFAGSNFAFMYYDGKTGNHYRLIDDENKKNDKFGATEINKDVSSLNLYGYENVKSNFLTSLKAVTSPDYLNANSINVPGLLLRYQKQLTLNSRPSVSINGINYTSYDLYDGGINFTLKNKGHVSFIVGTYNTGNPTYFYKLYSLKRNRNGAVSTIDTSKTLEIDKISNNRGKIGYHFASGETTEDYSASNIDFDFAKLNSGSSGVLKNYYAYYFEFLLNPGDYFLTSLPNKNDVPYILYLDIGANAGGALGTKVDRTIVYELLEQINESFTYPSGVAIVDFDNAVEDTKKLAIAIGSTYSGSVTMKYTGNNQAQVTLNSSNTDTGVAYFDPNLTINGGDITSSQVHESIQTLETQRLTYFDYNKETKIINVLTFSQTRETSSSKWGDTKRKDYQSGEGNTGFKQTDNPLTIYGDDGKSTDTLPSITGYEKINKNTNVFQMKMLRPLVTNSLDIDWKPMGTIPTEEDTPNYYFTIKGYDFVAKENNTKLIDSDYSIIKNPNYGLIFNGKTIQEK